MDQSNPSRSASRFVPSRMGNITGKRKPANEAATWIPATKRTTAMRHTHTNSEEAPVSASSVQHSPTLSQQHDDPRRLLKVITSLVRNRNGSVLSRQTILKAENFKQAVNTKLEFFLSGASNFRAAGLDCYGVAQPTVIGISSVLALLNCHPKSLHNQCCTWFLTREEPLVYINGYPYVLRDYADPLRNMRSFAGISAARLEMVEERLKGDVISESNALGGLLLVHQELDDGTVVPCLIASDCAKTPKEVFQSFVIEGYRLTYFRIPISPVQAPEDNYFDEYVRVIKTLEPTDPLIFNCGKGGVRTTVGTILAQLIRRAQLVDRGDPDPFPVSGYVYDDGDAAQSLGPELMQSLCDADTRTTHDSTMLRLIYILEKGLESKANSQSVIEWVFGSSVIENLKEAVGGNYYLVVSLISVLEHGLYCKRLLDQVIDRSDAVVNIRDDILLNRIRQTTQGGNDYRKDTSFLFKSLIGLQRYMALLCFTSYVNGSPNISFDTRFSSWFKARTEVWRMVQNMRIKGPQLYLFRPVDDLHDIGGVEAQNHGSLVHQRSAGMFEMAEAGAQSRSIALEAEEFILKSRTGVVLTSQTILKIDCWRQDLSSQPLSLATDSQEDPLKNGYGRAINSGGQLHHTFYINGAANFRRIPDTHMWIGAVAQPTVDGLQSMLRYLLNNRQSPDGKILWINLREEPIIYINGIPYVLRDRCFTLRNMHVYKGITGARLEELEERLKEDLVKEINDLNGRILLHGENRTGDVMTAWEDVNASDVKTVREVMETVAVDTWNEAQLNQQEHGSRLDYHRLPVTAEKVPDWTDFDEMRLLIGNHCQSNTSTIVLNCQVGVGRSTMGTVMATLIDRWMYGSKSNLKGTRPPLNYQIINSLLRVIKNGIENKNVVDTVIDQCGAVLNLRDMIESAHIKAEMADDGKKRPIIKAGIVALQRYVLLICFQAYLDNTPPDALNSMESFVVWSKRHAEIATILHELRRDDDTSMMNQLTPFEKSVGDGLALSTEVQSVVRRRCGQVLSQNSILKHDAFPGCQKLNLREKVDGAYNYRRVQVKTVKRAAAAEVMELVTDTKRPLDNSLVPPYICGCAMPSKDAIKAVLTAMDAGPDGTRKVLWTCLREEPVIYVNNEPFVLRLFSDPLKNLEITGIAKSRVEGMEHRMKQDALEERKGYGGRLLLHTEESDTTGGFDLKAIWETIPSKTIETPSEVFRSIIDEGYQVDYHRIPITDEQVPIPHVFDLLKQRILEATPESDILFNCQMGRGRTTTGMVTACLISMIMDNDLAAKEDSPPQAETTTGMLAIERNEVYNEQERYLNGEYKIILQAVSVLAHGKLAKRLTDRAINMCDHIQNLRQAIYDYRLRMEAMDDMRSKTYDRVRRDGLNYLIRYFYLVVFAAYLLEVSPGNSSDDQTSFTFKDWLGGRREITNIIRFQSFGLT